MGAAGMKQGKRTCSPGIASMYLQLLLGYGYALALGLRHPKFKAAVTKDPLSFCQFVCLSVHPSIHLSARLLQRVLY
jgi:hypothetical protein